MSSSKPLLVFDFDGVVVDGIAEYWWSARRACLKLLGREFDSTSLPNTVPTPFMELRPWVHKGWEMVLIAAELIRPDSPLTLKDTQFFANKYSLHCKEALKAWHWHPTQLQDSLDSVRKQAVTTNKEQWLTRHQIFPGVAKRLTQLKAEGCEFAVLTTKSSEFTLELLDHFQLNPKLVFGHEAGSKANVLLQLIQAHSLKGFIEDRRVTLETIINTPGLESLPCYLASWGYLKNDDTSTLPPSIHLLEPKTFMAPLADWP